MQKTHVVQLLEKETWAVAQLLESADEYQMLRRSAVQNLLQLRRAEDLLVDLTLKAGGSDEHDILDWGSRDQMSFQCLAKANKTNTLGEDIC